MDMKKTYETPKAEVERYQLDASIASNCETVVHNGPQMNGYSQCSDYIDPFETYSAAKKCAQCTVLFGGYVRLLHDSRRRLLDILNTKRNRKSEVPGCTSCYALAA